MTSMYVPKPVISLAIVPKDNNSQMSMSKALNRFSKEDPTFKTYVDAETNETIIEGMGELHLDIYVERMKREYGANVTTGNPRVAYRETITQRADFNYTHKKQTGGSGQFGRIAGYIEPISDAEFVFENKIFGGSIPTQYIPACEKGFRQSMAKGPKLEFPITGVKVVIDDGASHAVDSSVSGGSAWRLSGRLSARQTRRSRADHESGRRNADGISGFGDGAPQSAARHDHRFAGRGRHVRH
jgi:elongation factor G